MKFRYKPPKETKSTLIEVPVKAQWVPWRKASVDTRFAAAVASFGMQLRESAYKGSWDYDMVVATARETMGEDIGGYRAEFVKLVEKAQGLAAE